MAENVATALSEPMPPVEWDGRISVPTRYGEDVFGTMRVPAYQWTGRENRIWWCDGQRYHWNSTLELMEPWNAPVERRWDGSLVKPGCGASRLPSKRATVVGSFGWTLLWACFLGLPTLIVSGVLVGAVPPPPAGTTHAQDHAAVAISVGLWLAVWLGIHQFRVARCGR